MVKMLRQRTQEMVAAVALYQNLLEKSFTAQSFAQEQIEESSKMFALYNDHHRDAFLEGAVFHKSLAEDNGNDAQKYLIAANEVANRFEFDKMTKRQLVKQAAVRSRKRGNKQVGLKAVKGHTQQTHHQFKQAGIKATQTGTGANAQHHYKQTGLKQAPQAPKSTKVKLKVHKG